VSESRGYDDQLPWLQPVDDEDEQRGLSARKMLAALLVVLLAAAIVAATFFWIGRRDGSVAGAPQLIKAPATPYKIKPPNPGGLDISADSQTAFETSAGEDPDARLDTSKLPASTVPPPPKEETKTPAAAAAPKPPVAQPAPEPPKATGGTGSVVQLGAFANRTQAERAWTVLSSRFPNVAALNKMIVPFPGGIRLRGSAGSPGDAKQVCDTLKAAGENCFVAQ
jgi:cell division septation protein DedD